MSSNVSSVVPGILNRILEHWNSKLVKWLNIKAEAFRLVVTSIQDGHIVLKDLLNQLFSLSTVADSHQVITSIVTLEGSHMLRNLIFVSYRVLMSSIKLTRLLFSTESNKPDCSFWDKTIFLQHF